MSIFPFLKKKQIFTPAEKERIVKAIRLAEQQTSGEIKVYVEAKNPFVDPLQRAKELFSKQKMENTRHRNAVLLYVALKDKEMALFGDEGIHKAVGDAYWNDTVKKMIHEFGKGDITDAIVRCIEEIGQALKEKFPYNKNNDMDELTDTIVCDG